MKNKNIFREISEGLICLHYAQFSSIIFFTSISSSFEWKVSEWIKAVVLWKLN